MLHTHPAGAGSTLKGKRKKKANTDDGQKDRTEQGGEGNKRTSKTNLHGETDLTKTAHTPKPHDTLRRGTRGKLGTKWGTSWWQKRKPKQLIKQQDSVPNYLSVVRLFPAPGPWSSLAPIGIKRLSSSSELGAQHVSPPPDTKETTPAGKGHACCLHLLMPCIVSKAEAAGTKKEVSDCSEWLHMKECNSRGSQGDRWGRRTSQNGWQTARLTVALYLNELPN